MTMNRPLAPIFTATSSFDLAGGPPAPLSIPRRRCSIPFLKQGGVEFQTLALYRDRSRLYGQRRQADRLPQKDHSRFPEITWMPAIENGSGVIEEGESLETGLQRLEQRHRETEENSRPQPYLEHRKPPRRGQLHGCRPQARRRGLFRKLAELGTRHPFQPHLRPARL